MSANEIPKVVSAPIRMSPDLMAKVAEAVNMTGQKQAEILRLCLEIGLEDLRACKYDLPKLVADTAKALRVYSPEKEEETIRGIVDLPFYGLVAAGQPAAPMDTQDGTYPVQGSYDPVSHFVLRVNGRSMEPDYPDGSHIVCRNLKGEPAKKNQDVIACDSNGSYFKKLVYSKDKWQGEHPRKSVPRLVSINLAYDEVIPLADCPIMAVVVGKA
jgi:SOS-response transcriptional repressor LexA